MMPLVFEETLSDLRDRSPFEPFVVELFNGSRIEVEHPEALAYTRRRAVYVWKQGRLNIFDPDVVNRINALSGNGTG